MRIAIIGRTRPLIRAAELLRDAGYDIPIVWTARSEPYYAATESDFRELAASVGAKFIQSPDTRTSNGISLFREVECDAALSINWPVVMPSALLALFRLGILNAHAGDLPRYRGNACPNWALLNQETRIGLTIHQMDSGLDSGPIILKRYLDIDQTTYISDVYHWLDRTIPGAFLDGVERLADPAFSPTPQDLVGMEVLRTYPRRPSDALIDWRQDAFEIHRLVRASSRPFAGAFTWLEGQTRLTVWRAEVEQHPESWSAVPGQVCFQSHGDPVIACASGLLRLTDVSIGGLNHRESVAIVLESLRNRLTSAQDRW